jgi:hypothetical protein
LKYLHTIFFFLLAGFFWTCTTDSADDTAIQSEIKEARELIYLNRLEDAEAILIKLDSAHLGAGERAEFYLTNGFLQHGLGNRNLSLKYLAKASDLISDENDAGLSAEFNLINGFIFEQLILRSEASNAYFKAYEYFKNESSQDKLFYTLLGIARTSPGGKEYLKQAKELLGQLKSNRFRVIYMNAEAALMSDVRERNNTILKSLNYFDEDYDLKKQIFLYSKIAMNYQLLNMSDSAFCYLALSQQIIDDGDLNPQKILHFYNIKAYVESSNNLYDKALETLDVLFKNASNDPGFLSRAFLRRSLIMKEQGKYVEAYDDLKKYTKFEDEDNALTERYQLGLLSIRYQVQHKELQLSQARWNLVKAAILSIIIFFALWVMFWYSKKKLSKKKKVLEIKYAKTNKLLYEQVEESIKEAQMPHGDHNEDQGTESKLQEFGAFFRINHPLFREKLQKAHPTLTLNDIKHCESMLAGLTVFQTERLFGVTEGAVKKARKKLRELLHCKSSNELFHYLRKIDDLDYR